MLARIASISSLALAASLAACSADPEPLPTQGNETVREPHLPDLTIHEGEPSPTAIGRDVDLGAALSAAYPADLPIKGRDLRSYGNTYWSWYTAIPKSKHPALGGDCNVDQSGSVFYLAGEMSEGHVTHACTLPAGRSIFVPIVGALARPCPEVDGCGTARGAELVHSLDGALAGAEVAIEVDGVALAREMVGHFATENLSLSAPIESSEQIIACTGPVAANECGIAEGKRDAAADMFATMLRPLAKGKHVVHVTGKLPGKEGPVVVDVTWTLEVQ